MERYGVAIGLFIVTIAVISITAIALADPGDPWWDENWEYRQELNISANATCGTLTDYQFNFILNFSNGISNADTIYTNGHSQPDFDDVRFLNQTGDTLQPYWFEYINIGSDASVWVNFSTIATTGTTYYVYYGNLNVPNVSSGNTTFPIFDNRSVVAFWSMDEAYWDGTPGEAIDRIGNSNGVREGSANTTVGRFKRCGTFDRTTNDRVACGTSATLNIQERLTVDAWIKPKEELNSSTGYDPIIISRFSQWFFGIRPAAGGKAWVGYWDSVGAYIQMYGIKAVWGPTWHHVAIRFDNVSDTLDFFVNGSLDKTNPTNGKCLKNIAAGLLRIGDYNSANYWNGKLDEIHIFNTSLTNHDIEALSEGYMLNMSGYFNVRKYSTCNPEIVIAYGSEESFHGPPAEPVTNLSVEDIGGGCVNISWTAGVNSTGSHVEMGIGDCIATVESGEPIYNGSANYTIKCGISLDFTEYCFTVWAYNASGHHSESECKCIGGTGLMFIGYSIICIGLSAIAFWRRWTWVYMLAAIAWFGFGGYGLSGHSTGEIQWVFGWVGIAAGFILIMAPAWNSYKEKQAGQETQTDRSYDEELDEIYKETE